jgi:hypothetical protein
MTVSLATPFAALAGLVGVVPLAASFLRIRRGRRLRRELGLVEPSPVVQLGRPIALACLFGLLGLAAARPSIHVQHERATRTDAELVVVIDSSRSMLAAANATQPPRYERAVAFARRLRDALPEVPVGISSLTNRLLPYLFPTADARAYDLVLDESYGIERPPPALTQDRWVTTFEPLNQVAVRRFFSPTAHTRVLVVLSDAETQDFDARSVLRHLERAGTTPIVVRFWRPGERIFSRGRADASYRATEPGALVKLHDAGWPTFRESDFAAVVRLVRRTIGSGPVARIGYDRRETSLAPIVALAALAPLLLLVAPAGRVPAVRKRQRPTPTMTA